MLQNLIPPEREPKTLFLFDGTALIFRAFFSRDEEFSPNTGLPINSLIGFWFALRSLLAQTKASHFLCLFDSPGPNFRHQIFPEYKANRGEPPELLKPQFPLMPLACKALGCPSYSHSGWEADDLMASHCERYQKEFSKIVLVSPDKDLYQLVNERVELWNWPKENSLGPAQLETRFGFSPDKMEFFQSLRGDPTDNIPGITGVGEKTARVLVNYFSSIDDLENRHLDIERLPLRGAKGVCSKVRMGIPKARLSHQLVSLARHAPTLELDFLKCGEPCPTSGPSVLNLKILLVLFSFEAYALKKAARRMKI